MDPATILAINNSCLGITLKIGSVANEIYGFSKKYKVAEISLKSLSSQCMSYKLATSRIHNWLKLHQTTIAMQLGSDTLDVLRVHIETSGLLLNALDTDLNPLRKSSSLIGRKTRFLWSSNVLAEHEKNIHNQIAALAFLLQIIDLPSFQKQHDLLNDKLPFLQEIADSVRSFVASDRASVVSSAQRSSYSDVETGELTYKRLDFDDALYASEVYKRSNRFSRFIKGPFRSGSERRSKPDSNAQQVHVAHAPSQTSTAQPSPEMRPDEHGADGTADLTQPGAQEPESKSLEDPIAVSQDIPAGEGDGIWKLPINTAVPLLFDVSEDLINIGAFAEVFKARIDPEFPSFSAHRNKVFALKRFYREVSTSAEIEQWQKALKHMWRRGHPHIMQPLAFWEQDAQFHLLLPLAAGNLHTYLQQPFSGLHKSNVLWLFRQLLGLADALECIHVSRGLVHIAQGSVMPAQQQPRRGYHHNLKPHSILIFRENDQLVLKINGLTTIGFELAFAVSKLYRTRNVSDLIYGAPDYCITGSISRPYDIWSLGCIFLEILVWIFDEGDQAVTSFHERLKVPSTIPDSNGAFWFQDVTNGRVSLNYAVVEKIMSLQQMCKGCGVFKELVRLVAHMLTLMPHQRPVAPVVRSDLQAIFDQADYDLDGDPEFYLKKPGTRSDDIIVAAPATMPYKTMSRRNSIDDRTVYAPNFLSPGDLSARPYRGHRHSFSDIPDDDRPDVGAPGNEAIASVLTHQTESSRHNGESEVPPISIFVSEH